jgi:3' terminal RNA ribose 2'-O-methyltransferase Hen1
MLLTITTTHQPATDLGYLLHKHPAKTQTFKLNFGQAHVFYPEADEARCTAVLLLDMDAVKLVRSGSSHFALQQYVNDRPYVASSFLSVALANVYGSALNGRCPDRPQLVDTAIPLQATLTALPVRGGEAFFRRLFEPLGYTISAKRYILDEKFPEWGQSRYYTVTLTNTLRLRELLTHLYVLIPVLDDDKHYYVSQDEVDKLLRRSQDWLALHPEREIITRRYLKHRRDLMRSALDQLLAEEDASVDEAEQDAEEIEAEQRIGLHQQRLEAVLAVLKESGVARVMDLGCGEGKLLRLLMKEGQFTAVCGLDVSHRSLEIAADRLRLERLPPSQRERITLQHGSLLYRDKRLMGYEAAALVEVIEHLDAPRLATLERVLFGEYRPSLVVITTPNREYNAMWPSLPAGQFRHRDHRFEWTRAEFETWAKDVAETYGYAVQIESIGQEAEGVGAPSQMGVFRR